MSRAARSWITQTEAIIPVWSCGITHLDNSEDRLDAVWIKALNPALCNNQDIECHHHHTLLTAGMSFVLHSEKNEYDTVWYSKVWLPQKSKSHESEGNNKLWEAETQQFWGPKATVGSTEVAFIVWLGVLCPRLRYLPGSTARPSSVRLRYIDWYQWDYGIQDSGAMVLLCKVVLVHEYSGRDGLTAKLTNFEKLSEFGSCNKISWIGWLSLMTTGT